MAFFICYANVLTRFMYSVLPVRSCLFYEEQYENRENCDHMRKQGGGGIFTYTVSFYIDKDDWKSPASDLYTNERASLPGSKRSLFSSADIQSFLF